MHTNYNDDETVEKGLHIQGEKEIGKWCNMELVAYWITFPLEHCLSLLVGGRGASGGHKGDATGLLVTGCASITVTGGALRAARPQAFPTCGSFLLTRYQPTVPSRRAGLALLMSHTTSAKSLIFWLTAVLTKETKLCIALNINLVQWH